MFLKNITLYKTLLLKEGSWDSSVGIAKGYVLDGRGSIPGRSKRFLSAPQHPDQLWGLPSLQSNGYLGLLSWEKSNQGIKLTINLHLVLKSRNMEL
jgi:hypothetical protein